jgi:hypothetical protein
MMEQHMFHNHTLDVEYSPRQHILRSGIFSTEVRRSQLLTYVLMTRLCGNRSNRNHLVSFFIIIWSHCDNMPPFKVAFPCLVIWV